MFKITLPLALLILGSSASAALASTRYDENRRDAPTRVERTPKRPERFDHPGRAARSDRAPSRGARDDLGPRRYRPTWVALGASFRLARGAEDCVDVRDGGTFTQLRLQTDGGFAQVDRVIVQFADGSDQVAELDRTLDRSGALIEIPLDGNNRRIDRILVTGATGRSGALQVFGI